MNETKYLSALGTLTQTGYSNLVTIEENDDVLTSENVCPFFQAKD